MLGCKLVVWILVSPPGAGTSRVLREWTAPIPQPNTPVIRACSWPPSRGLHLSPSWLQICRAVPSAASSGMGDSVPCLKALPVPSKMWAERSNAKYHAMCCLVPRATEKPRPRLGDSGAKVVLVGNTTAPVTPTAQLKSLEVPDRACDSLLVAGSAEALSISVNRKENHICFSLPRKFSLGGESLGSG